MQSMTLFHHHLDLKKQTNIDVTNVIMLFQVLESTLSFMLQKTLSTPSFPMIICTVSRL